MTPGEAAVMKASVTVAPASPARRLAMSVLTASRSRHSMGPVQAGRDTVERCSRRAAASGKSAQSGRPRTIVVPSKPVSRCRT